ncbi:MAG: hypothetical protein RIQ93_335 [Verrucomicrobiota bacterium]|jgi:hypothetical protein
MNRRKFLAQSASLAAITALPRSFGNPAITMASPRGKAEHCIVIWLGGGLSQIDTLDPKKRGSSKTRTAGTDYDLIDTAVPGVSFTAPMARSARLAERMTVVRTVYHNIGEHGQATNFIHTGRPINGSTVYPSFGSIIVHERGAISEKAPPYLLVGYPNVSRGPGFLGPRYGYIYLTDTETGPVGFSPTDKISAERAARRQAILQPLQNRDEAAFASYAEAQRAALQLAGPGFMRNFQVDEEPAALRQAYGGEFGQRCLLARRLVQSGVRFIEVSHNLNFINGAGWDTHADGHLNQYALVQELDSAFSTLITDLESKRLLDKTLIVIGTEFGRPAEFDGGGGRGHQTRSFSLTLAGGGLKHRGAFGVTDHLADKIVEHPVSVPDFHATIHAAMGIDPAKNLAAGSRPVPITDGGKPIAALFG